LKSYSIEVTTKHGQEVIAAIDQAWSDVQSKGVIEMRKTLHQKTFKNFWRMAKQVYRGLAFASYFKVYADYPVSNETVRAKQRNDLEPSFRGYRVRLIDNVCGLDFADYIRAHKKDVISSRDVLNEWGVDVSEFRGF